MNTNKWMPEVGQECECTWKECPDWYKAIYHGTTQMGKHVVECLSNGVVNAHDKFEFRPITTEADKYRDEHVSAIARAISKIIGDAHPSDAEFDSALILYNSGCRILAPDERIVKPLTVHQKNYLWKNHGIPYATAEHIESVQRGLVEID